ncbi:MAG: FMN-binding glutamate synthase family protein [Verrucomicrobiales bacterium]|nr:FMN-binding glutamate synthase family protein [Verrucomicrobiales bacterium]
MAWYFQLFGLVAIAGAAIFIGVLIYDLVQRKHTILHNFPIGGHFRYMLEKIGPELRQYIVTDNDEERPFSRDQRTWVYASSKRQNNYFGFGTDNDLERSSNYLILKQSGFPKAVPLVGSADYDDNHTLPCAKVMGGWRERKKAFIPESAVCVSAMSYGSLGSAAVEALNTGCGIAGALHNTGEGGISKYHLNGGELILQLGTGYFGARNRDGSFCLEKLVDTVAGTKSIRAIEIKLSQGAKPGLGGVLPAAKVTPEIALARGIEVGKACISPSCHSAFSDIDSLLDFVELVAESTGLPVGIKSAVGDLTFWTDLAQAMDKSGRGPDFIAIDGGEGGTGAAPLAFSDHVSFPFKLGFSKVHRIFEEECMEDKVVFIGSARLGLPIEAAFAFALGCDMIGVAREAMMSIGCIQAQRCHTGHCPAGIATHNKWLMSGLDPTLKSARLANYITTLRAEMIKLSYSAGVEHPSQLTRKHFEILDDQLGSRSAADVF